MVLEAGSVVADGGPREVIGRLAAPDAPAHGIRLPEVTSLALALEGVTRGSRLPVTVDEAVAWLEGGG